MINPILCLAAQVDVDAAVRFTLHVPRMGYIAAKDGETGQRGASPQTYCGGQCTVATPKKVWTGISIDFLLSLGSLSLRIPSNKSHWNPGQKTTGQKTTGQKSTKNVNPGLKTTRTKDHPDKRHQAGFSTEKS